MATQDLDAPSVPLDADERECQYCGAIYFVDQPVSCKSCGACVGCCSGHEEAPDKTIQ